MRKWIKDKYKFDFNDLTTVIFVIGMIFNMCGNDIISTYILSFNCIISIIYIFAVEKRVNSLVCNLVRLGANILFLI